MTTKELYEDERGNLLDAVGNSIFPHSEVVIITNRVSGVVGYTARKVKVKARTKKSLRVSWDVTYTDIQNPNNKITETFTKVVPARKIVVIA